MTNPQTTPSLLDRSLKAMFFDALRSKDGLIPSEADRAVCEPLMLPIGSAMDAVMRCAIADRSTP